MNIILTESQASRLKKHISERYVEYPKWEPLEDDNDDVWELYDDANVTFWREDDEVEETIGSPEKFTPEELARVKRFISDHFEYLYKMYFIQHPREEPEPDYDGHAYDKKYKFYDSQHKYYDGH